MTKANRQRGAIFGAAIGDAIGLTYEFERPERIPSPPYEMVGGGPFGFAPGVGSDDTDLMHAVLKNYSPDGTFALDGAIKDMVAWLRTGPLDVGNRTRESLLHWRDYNEDPPVDEAAQGNGGLMRAMPHALLATRQADAASFAYYDTRATHNSDEAGNVSAFYAAVLWWLVHRDTTPTMAMYRARQINPTAFKDFTPYAHALCGNMHGHCLHSLRLALRVADLAVSFEDGISRVIRTGGDTDTNAAIAGGLLGARFGMSGIPDRWLWKLERANYARLDSELNRLGIKQPASTPTV